MEKELEIGGQKYVKFITITTFYYCTSTIPPNSTIPVIVTRFLEKTMNRQQIQGGYKFHLFYSQYAAFIKRIVLRVLMSCTISGTLMLIPLKDGLVWLHHHPLHSDCKLD